MLSNCDVEERKIMQDNAKVKKQRQESLPEQKDRHHDASITISVPLWLIQIILINMSTGIFP